VGDRSRGRFATPADSPRHDCSPCSHLHVRRGSLGFVRRSRAIFCRPVPIPDVTIRSFASPYAAHVATTVHWLQGNADLDDVEAMRSGLLTDAVLACHTVLGLQCIQQLAAILTGPPQSAAGWQVGSASSIALYKTQLSA
jgi:hypothetical protein